MTIFRHVVGKSTLQEGMAVPRALEEWIQAPAIGEKREIRLLFEGGQATATLRRIENTVGHVQIKYENRTGLPLRVWLQRLFGSTETGMEGEYLELVRIEGDTFQINAFPLSRQPSTRLVVTEWMFHRATDHVFKTFGALREIPAVVQGIEVKAHEGQGFYNRQLSCGFAKWNWIAEKLVVPGLALKSDFVKDGVQVEVEFGNARTYYQDYIKFMLAFNQKIAEIGVLVVPTEAFARSLCTVGREKAIAKGRHSYSGMIHLEKVRRELSHLTFMLNMPIAVVGIGVQGQG